MKNKINPTVWFPLAVAVAFVLGIVCDTALRRDTGRSDSEKKFSTVLELIRNEYVDDVDIDSLLEETFPALLANLDPHTVYIPAKDLAMVNEDIEGSFSGVGVSFAIENDTIVVLEAISGGPAERVGIKAGDRIVKVDGENVASTGVTNEDVFGMLRGEKYSTVEVTVRRRGVIKELTFDVVRDDIPVTTIDASYMIDDGIGYVRINKFGRSTFHEFLTSLYELASQGAEGFIVDLRGNPGGLLEASVLMVNEFMPANLDIVRTIGRHSYDNQQIRSDGTGSLIGSPLVVLIDEFSASASEIFAGAVQDNDRGVIVGRRSFGKGLVQNQIDLPDGSALRLTVARYYTPSGRCIQKDYSDAESYENDLIDRYYSGEIYEADSIKNDDTMIFHTRAGRTVYGGGGITPDVFVPNDTAHVTGYYLNVANAGLFQKYALQFADDNRAAFDGIDSVDRLMRMLPPDEVLLRSFVSFCSENGINPRWYYINISAPLIVNRLKALIARDIIGIPAYYEVVNATDPDVEAAINQIRTGIPVLNRKN